MESHYELLKLFLPELLVDYFDLTKSKKEGDLLHLFFEEQNKWTKDQKKRAVLLFKLYPDIQVAYQLLQQLTWIF